MSQKFANAFPELRGIKLDQRDPLRRQLLGFDEGRTKQQFKDECDINNIMKKYERNLLLDHVNRFNGQYADVTGDVDYQTALNTIISAEEAFFSIPAKIRARFENDPQRFLEFVSDPSNREELGKMGLLKKAVAQPGSKPREPGTGESPGGAETTSSATPASVGPEA